MEQPPVESGAPSTASPAGPISAQTALDTMSDAERTSWQKDGALPERIALTSKKDATAASSPAQPDDQAVSTDATTDRPTSETGQPETDKKPKGAKLKARNAELDEENRQLQERLKLRRALRDELAQMEPRTPAKSDETPESSSARGEWDGSDPRDPKPDANDPSFETHEAYLDARDSWNERRGQRKVELQRSIAARVDVVSRLAQTATARMQEYQKAHPDFDATSIDDRLLAIPPASALPPGTPIGPQHALAEEVLKSPVTPQLLQHFSTDAGRADWARLLQIGQRDPAECLRAFGRLEARFDTGAAGPSAPKHTSDAPEPAHVLGSRSMDTSDPEAKAIQRKDFSAYSREANKRQLAALGG